MNPPVCVKMWWILLLFELSTASSASPNNEDWWLEKISKDISLIPRSADEMMTYSAYTSHPCSRPCKKNDRKYCYYNFLIDTYETKADCGNCPYNKADCYKPHCITTDGVKTQLLTYNYMLPGPIISVCEEDTVVIHATNYLAEGTSIHSHGMGMRSTPNMDGVINNNQYAINPFTTFVYNYPMDRSGTLWYHSHAFFQRGFGLFAALISRVPDELNPMRRHYDQDSDKHVVVICDWRINFKSAPVNLLVNGRGHDQNREYNPPIYSIFNVYRNKRYRFRFIFAGTASCSVVVSIKKHFIILIAIDGTDIEMIKVSSFVMLPAQRFDGIVETDQAIDNYWIVVKGLTGCVNMTNVAILHYDYAPDAFPKQDYNYDETTKGVQVNTLDVMNLTNPLQVPVYTLNALQKYFPPAVKTCRFYLTIDALTVNGTFAARINKITGTVPETVSILQAKNHLQDNFFCNVTSLKNSGVDCGTTLCSCHHRLKLPLNSYCEIFLVNNMSIQHPIHLHGYTFRVTGAGKLTQQEINDVRL